MGPWPLWTIGGGSCLRQFRPWQWQRLQCKSPMAEAGDDTSSFCSFSTGLSVCVCVCVCVHAWWGEVAESFSKGPVYGRSEAWRLMTQSPRPSFPPSMQIRCQLINQNIWETRAGGPPSRLSQKASLNSQAWSELYGFLASLWILSLLSHGCTEFFPLMQVALIKSEKSDSIFIAEGEGSEKERERGSHFQLWIGHPQRHQPPE